MLRSGRVRLGRWAGDGNRMSQAHFYSAVRAILGIRVSSLGEMSCHDSGVDFSDVPACSFHFFCKNRPL